MIHLVLDRCGESGIVHRLPKDGPHQIIAALQDRVIRQIFLGCRCHDDYGGGVVEELQRRIRQHRVQRIEKIRARHFGHHHVQDHHRIPLREQMVEGVDAVACGVRIDPLAGLQVGDQSGTDRLVIFDYEYSSVRCTHPIQYVAGIPPVRSAMAGKKEEKNQKLNISLTPEQVEWLKRDKEGPSAAVRALITEAINMERLARSVAKKKRK